MNNAPKHTPGPWKLNAGRCIETTSGTFFLSYGSDRYGNPNFREPVELDANARLVAAAPELLAALREVTRCLGWHAQQHPVGKNCIAVSQARAAIAKATGEGDA